MFRDYRTFDRLNHDHEEGLLTHQEYIQELVRLQERKKREQAQRLIVAEDWYN